MADIWLAIWAITISTVPSSILAPAVIVVTSLKSMRLSGSASGSSFAAILRPSSFSSSAPGISGITPMRSTPRSCTVLTSAEDISWVSARPNINATSSKSTPAAIAIALRHGLPSSPMSVKFIRLKFSCTLRSFLRYRLMILLFML